MLRSAKSTIIASMAFVICFTINAHATCIGITGDPEDDAVDYAWTWVPPDPWTIIPNGYNDNILYVWNEQQNVTLTEPLFVDWVADPNAPYVQEIPEGGYYLKQGTVVSSHYVQWDPDGVGEVHATLHFDAQIFAYITSDQALFDSDAVLGLPWVDYNDFAWRGIEPPPHENADVVTVLENGIDVEIRWQASNPGDWIRLLTAFSPGGMLFVRGDTNSDGAIDIADAICVLGYLFGSPGDECKAKCVLCLDACDANDDGSVDIADAISILAYLFGGAGPLPEPFPECGTDQLTPGDPLDCKEFAPCP